MFFTTKAASKFVRERLETRNRRYSLTKQQQLIFNLQQNNSDYDHCAHLVSVSLKEPNPGLKTHSQMCESALRELESHLEDTTIFSKVNVSICDIVRKKGKIIQDSLKYEFIIDDILNIKRNPKREKVDTSITTPLFNYFLTQILEEISKKNGSVDVKTKINPATLEVVVRTSLVDEVTLELNNDEEQICYSLDPPKTIYEELPKLLIKDNANGIHEILTKWLEINTGYESVDYDIYSGKSKDDNFIKWTFSTPIFFSQDDIINYEKLIYNAETFKYMGRNNPEFLETDNPHEINNRVDYKTTSELRLVTSADLKNKYGVHGKLEFKSIYERIFGYINECLIKDRNVYRYLDDESCVIINVVVPYNDYPEASITDITGKICDVYREEGDFITVNDEHIPDSGLVIFSFFLNDQR